MFFGSRADLSAADVAEVPVLGGSSSLGATTRRTAGWNPSSTMDLVREIVARDQQRRTIMMMGLPEVGPPRAYPRQEIDSELTLGMKKAGVALVAAPEPDRRDVRAPPPTQTQLDAQ